MADALWTGGSVGPQLVLLNGRWTAPSPSAAGLYGEVVLVPLAVETWLPAATLPGAPVCWEAPPPFVDADFARLKGETL